MATYSLSPLFNGWQGYNAAGQPLNLGTITVYLAGTTTLTTTWTTSSAGTANSNPITLTNGFPPDQIWLQDGVPVKFVVKDAAGATLSTDDNIPSLNDWFYQFALSSGSSLVGFIQAGTGAVAETEQTALRRWCWAEQYGAVGNGSTDDYAAIVRGWTAGFKHVRLMSGKNYKINTGFVLTAGQRLIGEGKSNTTLTLGADIIPFDVTNVNDAGADGLLVVAYASQTQPIVRLTASTATVTRNTFRDIQVSASALTFTPIQLRCTTAAFGVWNNIFDDWSISGVGTVVELNTAFAGSWVRQNKFTNFYVNDYIIGMDFVRTAGDGSSDNVFRDWGAQSSARTTYGFRIPDSTKGQNQYNLFDAVAFYDMPAGGVHYSIGAEVYGTEIRNSEAIDFPNSVFCIDHGVRTRNTGSPSFAVELQTHGHSLQIPTAAGWVGAVTASGVTSAEAAYSVVRTGVTVNATARRYTEAIGGFASTTVFGIDFGKNVIFRFNISRATAEANAVGRIQLKTTQAEGALAGVGMGIRVTNYAIYGESYGSAGAFVDLSTTMSDVYNYQIEIRHYQGSRVEWWVNGVWKVTQSTAANLPTGVQTIYLVHSIITTISNPSADAQLFLLQPYLWSEIN